MFHVQIRRINIVFESFDKFDLKKNVKETLQKAVNSRHFPVIYVRFVGKRQSEFWKSRRKYHVTQYPFEKNVYTIFFRIVACPVRRTMCTNEIVSRFLRTCPVGRNDLWWPDKGYSREISKCENDNFSILVLCCIFGRLYFFRDACVLVKVRPVFGGCFFIGRAFALIVRS